MGKHVQGAPLLAWFIFLAAALLEVGGDALIRVGLRGSNLIVIGAGLASLGCYGLVVNLLKWNFAELLGAYIAVFALVSILGSHFVFHDNLPLSTWAGLALIVAGGLLIQFVD